MKTNNTPKTSPFGVNKELSRLVADVKSGARKLDAKTAEQAMNLVQMGGNSPGNITAEEVAAMQDLYTLALKQDVTGTPWGRQLVTDFADVTRTRLGGLQLNAQFGESATWLKAVYATWGAYNPFFSFEAPQPSYISAGKTVLQGKMRDTTPAAQEARERTMKKLAGQSALMALLKKYPAAVADPGHSYKAPTLRADVQARYDALVADLERGVVKDEKDPLAPLARWLKTHA